jgi:hypothetical protein
VVFLAAALRAGALLAAAFLAVAFLAGAVISGCLLGGFVDGLAVGSDQVDDGLYVIVNTPRRISLRRVVAPLRG